MCVATHTEPNQRLCAVGALRVRWRKSRLVPSASLARKLSATGHSYTTSSNLGHFQLAKRESQKISQSTLAERLGQQQTYVSKCETGVRWIDVVELSDWLIGIGIEHTDFVLKLQERWEAHAVRIGQRPKDRKKKPS
ncbi:MAG: hypothetical protein CFE43_21335 [Burkholderiales bacterium PBB3]|nr:MAG: hypothetical protein CFE43_21335 [Burkholderiales bacterium PBB3]